MAEDAAFPVAGTPARGLDPIFTKGKRKDVPTVNHELIDSILRRESVMVAPAGAVTPGHMVHCYRAALLVAAVVTHTQVHYAMVHWHTPAGCSPTSQSVIYGPDPNVCDASGCGVPGRSLLPRQCTVCRISEDTQPKAADDVRQRTCKKIIDG